MDIIKLKVQKQLVTIEETQNVVAGTNGLYGIQIEFDSEWDDIVTKMVTFISPNAVQKTYIYDQETMEIPQEVLQKPGQLIIGIYGIGQDGIRKNTTFATRNMVTIQPATTMPTGPDPVPATTPDIWSQILSDLLNKVDKEPNKTLTSNDFTDALKNKLIGLHNFDDAEIQQNLETIFESIAEHDRDLQNIDNDLDTLEDDVDTMGQELDALGTEVEQMGKKSEAVFDVGNNQFIYNSTILPMITAEQGRQIYEAFISGKPCLLKWNIYGTANYLTIISADIVGSTYSIDVCVHNQYHIAYSWTEETTGNVTAIVSGTEHKVLSQAEFEALTSYDDNTVYLIY